METSFQREGSRLVGAPRRNGDSKCTGGSAQLGRHWTCRWEITASSPVPRSVCPGTADFSFPFQERKGCGVWVWGLLSTVPCATSGKQRTVVPDERFLGPSQQHQGGSEPAGLRALLPAVRHPARPTHTLCSPATRLGLAQRIPPGSCHSPVPAVHGGGPWGGCA